MCLLSATDIVGEIHLLSWMSLMNYKRTDWESWKIINILYPIQFYYIYLYISVKYKLQYKIQKYKYKKNKYKLYLYLLNIKYKI